MRRDAKGKALSLPCGKCIGCRLERARQWAVRIMHESEMHEDSCFITLTYRDEDLPPDGSISVSVAQLFMKRLRARIAPVKVRFFLVGEYGEVTGRAHYHLLLFGYDFPDKVVLSETPTQTLYRSDILADIWGFGNCSIGQVTFDSACYVAKYACKKIIGKMAAAHYRGRLPEFCTMSRRPGIGSGWIKKFSSDVFPSDEVIVKGFPARPPRFYDKFLEVQNPDLFSAVKVQREAAVEALVAELEVVSPGWTDLKDHVRNLRRIEVREIVATAKAALKSRTLE